MRLDRTAPLAPAALAALVVWACACKRAPAEPPTASADASSRAARCARRPARSAIRDRSVVPALVGMIFHAARDLTLSPEQTRALDRIDASLRAADDAVRSALRTLEAHVVAGIRAGKLDPKTTAPDYAALDAATKDRAPSKQADALGALRSLLTPAQREDLVLAVRARRAAHSLRPPGAPEEEADDWTQRRLERLDETVGLDDGQKKRSRRSWRRARCRARRTSRRARTRREGERGRAPRERSRLDHFFDARTLDAGAITGRSGEDLIEGEDAFLGQLTPCADAGAAGEARRIARGPGAAGK